MEVVRPKVVPLQQFIFQFACLCFPLFAMELKSEEQIVKWRGRKMNWLVVSIFVVQGGEVFLRRKSFKFRRRKYAVVEGRIDCFICK